MALHIELGDIGHQLLVGRGCAEVALQNVRHLRITHARNMPGVPSPDIGINQANVRSWLWIQPIDATHSLNISAGVLYPKVFLGRSFNFLAIASNSSCE